MAKQNLRAGRSIWEEALPALPAAPLAHDLAVDVLVVGAGVTGALVAEALTAAGHKIAILDRRGPAKGSTAASTALLLFEVDTPLTKLAVKIGQTRAARAWRRSSAAMQALAAKMRALDIPCDFVPRESLYLAGDTLDAAGLAREAAARQAIGLPSQLLDGATVFDRYGIDRPAAILSGNSAEADPVRMAAGLLLRALERGAALHAPEEVTEVQCGAGRVCAATKGGHVVAAKHVVFCCGYEIPDFVPHEGHKIVSTWAIATGPQHDQLWHERCLIWEASDPYLYLRTVRGGRILVGGEDEELDDAERRDALLPAKARALTRRLGALLPRTIPECELAWTGFFGKSPTGLPTIGAVPGLPGCYAVLGFGGNGMTYAQIAAEMIARAVGGERDQDEDLFEFSAASANSQERDERRSARS